MKKILVVLLSLLSMAAVAQQPAKVAQPQQFLQYIIIKGYSTANRPSPVNGTLIYNTDSSKLQLAVSSTWLTIGGTAGLPSAGTPGYAISINSGVVSVDTSNFRKIDTVFKLNDTAFAMKVNGGPQFSIILGNTKLRISDTTAMLAPYLRKADTAGMLLAYLRKQDTATMLAPYFRKVDTASLSLGVASKLNKSDTGTMLAPYLRKADTGTMLSVYLRKIDTALMLGNYLRKVDTASLSTRINLKVNIADTGNMLSAYLRKIDTTAMLSKYLRKIDTTLMLGPYLRKIDTTAMLGPYARSNGVVKYADTPGILGPYLRKVDTATLSTRINLKVNISDTGTMLSVYLRKVDTAAMLNPYLRSISGVKYTDSTTKYVTPTMLLPYIQGTGTAPEVLFWKDATHAGSITGLTYDSANRGLRVSGAKMLNWFLGSSVNSNADGTSQANIGSGSVFLQGASGNIGWGGGGNNIKSTTNSIVIGFGNTVYNKSSIGLIGQGLTASNSTQAIVGLNNDSSQFRGDNFSVGTGGRQGILRQTGFGIDTAANAHLWPHTATFRPGTPSAGYWYYDSDSAAFVYYNGSIWQKFGSGAGSGSGPCVGCLINTNNLSDVSSAPTAWTNLGGGASGKHADAFFLQAANNGSDIPNTTNFRSALGLGTAATQASATFMQVANNGSDIANNNTFRTNLGLKSLAILDTVNLAAKVGVSILPIGNGGTNRSTAVNGIMQGNGSTYGTVAIGYGLSQPSTASLLVDTSLIAYKTWVLANPKIIPWLNLGTGIASTFTTNIGDSVKVRTWVASTTMTPDTNSSGALRVNGNYTGGSNSIVFSGATLGLLNDTTVHTGLNGYAYGFDSSGLAQRFQPLIKMIKAANYSTPGLMTSADKRRSDSTTYFIWNGRGNAVLMTSPTFDTAYVKGDSVSSANSSLTVTQHISNDLNWYELTSLATTGNGTAAKLAKFGNSKSLTNAPLLDDSANHIVLMDDLYGLKQTNNSSSITTTYGPTTALFSHSNGSGKIVFTPTGGTGGAADFLIQATNGAGTGYGYMDLNPGKVTIGATKSNGVGALLFIADSTNLWAVGLPNKVATGTDSMMLVDATGKLFKTVVPAGGSYTLPTASTSVLGGVKVDGSTITITAGVISATTSGLGTSNFVFNETPSGTINGSNVTFTIANTPTSGTLVLTKNGLQQKPTTDYTISSGTITMVVAPATGALLLANYMK